MEAHPLARPGLGKIDDGLFSESAIIVNLNAVRSAASKISSSRTVMIRPWHHATGKNIQPRFAGLIAFSGSPFPAAMPAARFEIWAQLLAVRSLVGAPPRSAGASGMVARRKPSLAASLRRASPCATGPYRAGEARSRRKRPESAAKGDVARGGDQRRRRGQVSRRLADPKAAGDGEIDVMLAELQAGVGLQHCDDHGKARGVPAHDGAARRAERAGATRA